MRSGGVINTPIQNMGIIKRLIEMGRIKREGRTYPPGTKVCASCKEIISPAQKRTKQMGLYFHRTCWKKEKKSLSAFES